MKKSRIIINTDEIRLYLKDLKKIPLVSNERQDEILTALKNKNTSKDEIEKLKSELVIGNLRFVVSIAKTYQNQGLDLLDLISEGNIGLLKAIDRFDPSAGLKFISYGVWWIRQSIMSSLNENGRTIRIPSNLIQEEQKSKKNESKHDVFDVFDEDDDNPFSYTLPRCISISNPINNEGDELIDVIRDPNENNPEDHLNNSDEVRKKVVLMLSVLDERERVIVEKYYGLNGIESSLEDLGEEFGCTKERVRQLKDRSLKKLRNESYNLLKYL